MGENSLIKSFDARGILRSGGIALSLLSDRVFYIMLVIYVYGIMMLAPMAHGKYGWFTVTFVYCTVLCVLSWLWNSGHEIQWFQIFMEVPMVIHGIPVALMGWAGTLIIPLLTLFSSKETMAAQIWLFIISFLVPVLLNTTIRFATFSEYDTWFGVFFLFLTGDSTSSSSASSNSYASATSSFSDGRARSDSWNGSLTEDPEMKTWKKETYIDASGCYRKPGDTYMDASGAWRKPGEDYVDYSGAWRKAGDTYVDASGAYRKPGEPYVDSNGDWHR